MWPGAIANPAVLDELFRVTDVQVASDRVKMLTGDT